MARLISHNLVNSRAGFTLIEFIMLIVVVGIALVPMINMFLQGVVGSADSEVATIINELAKGKMEETKQAAFSSVAGSSGTFSSPFEAYSFQVAVEYVDANFNASGSATPYKKIVVKVSHSSGTSLSLVTIMSDHN